MSLVDAFGCLGRAQMGGYWDADLAQLFSGALKFLLRLSGEPHPSFQRCSSVASLATVDMVTIRRLGPELSTNRMASPRTLISKKRLLESCFPMVMP